MIQVKVENRVTRDEVLDAKNRLNGKDKEIFESYLNHLSSYTKQEADAKRRDVSDMKILREEIVSRAFPDKSVHLRDIRRAIRREFYL